MIDDITMMMIEGDVIGINQCLCLPKADLNTKKTQPDGAVHGSSRQMELHPWWNTSQLSCVSSFLFHLEKHPAWNTSQLSDFTPNREQKQNKTYKCHLHL